MLDLEWSIAWSPHLIKDVQNLEKVKRKATEAELWRATNKAWTSQTEGKKTER
jgi:hypothetical protein